MAATIGALIAELSANSAAFQKDLGKAASYLHSFEASTNKTLSMVHRGFSRLGNSVAAFLSVGAIVKFGEASIEAARQSEEASARLGAVLKATGNAAGLTRDDLDKMAESMAASTQFDDESIRNAASELLKFRNIQGDTFRETLKLSADVAAFFGDDIPSAAAKLGKSMEDPESAFGLLKKAGVVLTEQQKDLIRSMEMAGDKAGAQQVILEKLKGTFGGTAEAMNTGITKSTNDLKKSWDELLESIGKTQAVSGGAIGGMGAFTGIFTNLKKLIDETDESARNSILFKLGKIEPRRLTPEQGGPVPGGKNLLEGITPGNFEEKANAALAAQAQKEKVVADAAYERQKKTQGILSDLRKSTLENQAAITEDEKQKAQLRVDAAKQEMDKKLRELEKQGVSRKAVESEYNKWLASEQAKADYESRTAMEKLNADWQNGAKQMREATAGWAKSSTDAIVEWGMTGKNTVRDFVNSALRDLLRLATQKNITGPLFAGMESGGFFSSIAAMFGGGMATGGPVSAGTAYMVGERGPEMFLPKTNGSIVPNNALGGANVTVNVINQTSTPVQADNRGGRFDGDGWVVDVVLRNIDNYGPLHTAISGMR